MTAIWRRGEQHQLNMVSTPEMKGQAGTVVILKGRPVILLEDLTDYMLDRGDVVGVATAGVWDFAKGSVAFTPFDEVFVDSAGNVAVTGTFIGVAESVASATDATVSVVFDSFGSPQASSQGSTP